MGSGGHPAQGDLSGKWFSNVFTNQKILIGLVCTRRAPINGSEKMGCCMWKKETMELFQLHYLLGTIIREEFQFISKIRVVGCIHIEFSYYKVHVYP